ncbi:unnamed protein product [Rangifer tarandus platyrhynchus]|uniref:Uncharacterized protein n=1 Tax=Rangifer tarandus platyrhynchus TaxID=3082113 RepID=A0AC60A7E0_RANTA
MMWAVKSVDLGVRPRGTKAQLGFTGIRTSRESSKTLGADAEDFQRPAAEPCSQGHGPDVLTSPLQTLGPPAAVHPARAHSSLCSRKPPGSFGTHLGIPPGGRVGGAGAAGWLRRSVVSPAGRLPFLVAPCGGRENNEPAGQTEDRLTHLHTRKRGSNG